MRLPALLSFCCLGLLLLSLRAATGAENWPQFRGPNCSGLSPTAKPPMQIGPDQNLLWKIDVPWAPSSPVVWGDRIVLTAFANTL